jgi:hypothetical protein
VVRLSYWRTPAIKLVAAQIQEDVAIQRAEGCRTAEEQRQRRSSCCANSAGAEAGADTAGRFGIDHLPAQLFGGSQVDRAFLPQRFIKSSAARGLPRERLIGQRRHEVAIT